MTATEVIATRMSAIEGLIVRRDEPMSRHTSFGLGGAARLFVAPSSVAQVRQVADALPPDGWMTLGGGTNVLFDDSGFDGLVVCTRSLRGCAVTEREVHALAGTALADVVRAAMENGLSGLEKLWGIPGTVGGAIAGNAGAFGMETFDCLKRVSLAAPGGSRLTVEATDLAFGYRRGGIPAGHMIIEAAWLLEPKDTASMRATVEQIRERRAASQPWGWPTAGCVFRNPAGDSAGRLIEHAGLKGARVGGAVVSTVHANFIVVDGPARARDVQDLAWHVRERVRQVTGIDLETELVMVGGAR